MRLHQPRASASSFEQMMPRLDAARWLRQRKVRRSGTTRSHISELSPCAITGIAEERSRAGLVLAARSTIAMRAGPITIIAHCC